MKCGVLLKRRCLATVIGASLISAGVYGQSTTSNIYGQVPAEKGNSVVIRSDTGLRREIQVDSSGRYNATQLPVGNYTVTLMRNGTAVQTHDHVVLNVGVGVNVSFAEQPVQAKQLSGVSVTANSTPPIDVSSVDSRTVITAQQLAALPLGRSAEAAALLAPGAVLDGGGFSSTTGAALPSFGGSSVETNAYYINGFNTTDPWLGQGGITLPYGSISQEEVYTGGYSAQYGRSDGGVLNLIGKSGTNEWHFGGQMLYTPGDLVGTQANTYYANGLPPLPVAGNLFDPNSRDRQWSAVYDAYLGGPIIKDKLFFFLSAEMTNVGGRAVGPVASSEGSPINSGGIAPATGTAQNFQQHQPKWYAKINWNITDKNLLELTAASSKQETSGSVYDYDYKNLQETALAGYANDTKSGGHFWSAKFTSYITDDLTFTALYGQMKTFNYSVPVGYNPDETYISGATYQNPALNNGVPNNGDQIVSSLTNPYYTTNNLRLSLTYVLGDHTISAGIDNLQSRALNQLTEDSGPGYQWAYGYTPNPTEALVPALGVGPIANYPNGASGYYVSQNVSTQGGNLTSVQHAEYIEDQWQVSDRWLLSIGLRDDGFTNENASSQPYMRQTKPQWSPRIGFSWDVNGDGSFKVYGNAGRYYLGGLLVTGLEANPVLITQQYYTYSGIAANGTPTGLTQVSQPVSANNFYGQTPNPNTVTAQNLKSEDQDEFILGFTKTLGSSWIYGAKAMRRTLQHDVEQYCDNQRIIDKAASMGIDDVSNATCYYFNPGQANTFAVQDPSGAFHNVTLTNAELGLPSLSLKYYSLETFLEHPFDGKWYGKIDYLFSRSYGNTESLGQTDIQALAANLDTYWNFPELMQYAGGPLGQDHTHQIKAYGYYQLTPEWQVSANLTLVSGGPKNCLGLYGPNQTDPDGYGSLYNWCNGQPAPPGAAGRMPWMKQVDVGVRYRPAFAENKLGFSLDVVNLFNSQTPLNEYSEYNNPTVPAAPNPLYGTPMLLQTPRYVRFGVTYDY
ncbi:TonB-dependent receptor [Dyella mobilis]|uniref:TonB-dependent receptor n=1 Tax=Dyella mobilis TaxID=1849582 RepID=A0ABS2KLR7_9GAMM|nr:TonB-dependent receptor [Dyella mobilis]MBM7132105.1 TonB-dependent receptor [Dyella mobilis]